MVRDAVQIGVAFVNGDFNESLHGRVKGLACWRARCPGHEHRFERGDGLSDVDVRPFIGSVCGHVKILAE